MSDGQGNVVYFALTDETYEILRNVSKNLDKLDEHLDEMGMEFTKRMNEPGSDDRHRVIAASLAFTKIVHSAMNTNGRTGKAMMVDVPKGEVAALAKSSGITEEQAAAKLAADALMKKVGPKKGEGSGGVFDDRRN